MYTLLWLLAVILLVGWLLGAFVFNVGGFIHLLLILIAIAIIINLVTGPPVAHHHD